jgi:diguanylate cyclase
MLTDPQISVQPPAHARDLATAVAPLPAAATCERARDAFDHDGGLFAVAIVDEDGCPIGLINRFKFLERLASRFGRELVLKKPVTALMEVDPLIIDEATHIDELGTRLMSQQHRYVFDGFIVTRDGRYTGLGTGLDLIRALTERRHAELQQMALHDMLTGLPNRTLFERHLTAALAQAQPGPGVAVVFLDLDRFKEINDTFGHRFGDLVLCGISQRLRAAVRKSDVVARLSGDEFAIVLPDINQPGDAAAIASVLLTSCGAPLAIEGREVVVSCSIGVALYPQHGATKEELIRAADTAQYHAKESRNSWQAYHSEMREWSVRTPGLSALRQAIEQGQLEVHYQPIVSLASGEVHSVEALVRWPHHTGMVPAADIVTLAETSGVIGALTEYVMQKAFRQVLAWDRERGRTDLRLAINISAVQVNSGLVAMIDRLLHEQHFDPSRLDLELTERAAMRASPGSLSALETLRARGITLTLDDFGTGYSALSRLERLPIDAMKIDKAFLERVDVEGNGVIARAIIAMAHALGMTIVGEGVETAAQLEFLRREGCEFAQGYFLARPAPPEHCILTLDRDFR